MQIFHHLPHTLLDLLQHQKQEHGAPGGGDAGPRGAPQMAGRYPAAGGSAGREGSPGQAGGVPGKPPLAGKPVSGTLGSGPGMPPGKPGPGQYPQYPGTAPGAGGQGVGGGGREGGQGAYPPYLQQQNQLLARHLQQPMGLPLNRLTPQQTQQVRLLGSRGVLAHAVDAVAI